MCRILNILLTVLSGVLFALHGIMTVWCVVEVKCDHVYWLLLIGVALLGVQMITTIKCPCNTERKWFSPTVFLYLSIMIPSVWFLELELLKFRQKPASTPTSPFLFLSPEHFVELVDILEQTMFIVLILGRWLMPKGDLSHDQLSKLLMVYVSLSADILDISNTFKKSDMKTNLIAGLSLFSWASMKFLFPRKMIHFKRTSPQTSCCTEIWRHLLTDGLQDGSFLVYRLYQISKESGLGKGKNSGEKQSIFFICKNIITVMLVLYRIGVVCFGCKPQRQTERVEGE